MSNAAHPGYARTDLIANGPGTTSLLSKLSLFIQPFASHSAAAGALPLLYAATSPDAQCSGYYGPAGFYELKGATASAHISANAQDIIAARRLWDISTQLTGAQWPST